MAAMGGCWLQGTRIDAPLIPLVSFPQKFLERKALGQRKLILLLEAENTLVNIQREPGAEDEGRATMHLRPGAQWFLRAVKDNYHIYLTTGASLGDAHRMKALLEGGERIFEDQIFCKDRDVPKDDLSKKLFYDAEPFVVKMDHCTASWTESSNLLLTTPYVGSQDLPPHPVSAEFLTDVLQLYSKVVPVEEYLRYHSDEHCWDMSSGEEDDDSEESQEEGEDEEDMEDVEQSADEEESDQFEDQMGNLQSADEEETDQFEDQMGNLQYEDQMENLQYGDQMGNLQYGDQMGNLQYGGQMGNLQYEDQMGDLQYEDQMGDLQYEDQDEREQCEDQEEMEKSSGTNHDEFPLLLMAHNLRKIHQIFYSIYDYFEKTTITPTWGIVTFIRKEVLKGAQISIVLLPEQVQEKETLRRAVVSLGATYIEGVSRKKTTYVITTPEAKHGYEDFSMELMDFPDPIKTLNPRWLQKCFDLLHWEDDSEYVLDRYD